MIGNNFFSPQLFRKNRVKPQTVNCEINVPKNLGYISTFCCLIAVRFIKVFPFVQSFGPCARKKSSHAPQNLCYGTSSVYPKVAVTCSNTDRIKGYVLRRRSSATEQSGVPFQRRTPTSGSEFRKSSLRKISENVFSSSPTELI